MPKPFVMNTSKKQSIGHIILAVLFLYFFWLMLRLTLEYIPYSTNVAFLMIKQTEVTTLPWYRYVFYTHVYTSIFILLFGFIQFFTVTGKIKKHIHRILGYMYVSLILLCSAPSGLYMGMHANGGNTAIASFVILSIIWWASTFMAMKSILQQNIIAHKHYMIRSYALTLSAVTLRMWKVIIVTLLHLPPMDTYKIIAWMGWVPNLIIAELIIYYKTKQIAAK